LDANRRPLATLRTPTIDALKREGRTMLLPVERSEAVPPKTVAMRVVLSFASAGGRRESALADDLRLVLSEYER
jgi:hypothetical protein